jgi:hypothetical protein
VRQPRPEPPARPPAPGTGADARQARSGYLGDGPPTYEAEPAALPQATAEGVEGLVADTVLDGARYGAYTLRAVSVRGDSARYRGEHRREALLTARFGTGAAGLVLVAVAGAARGSDAPHLAAAELCRWIGGAVARSHARLSEDIRAGRRGDLKSGLHRLTDRGLGRLRAAAAQAGGSPEDHSAGLRCLLLSADPECRNRIFFGVGPGGLFRLRDGVWQDIEPVPPGPETTAGAPVVGYGSGRGATPAGASGGDRPVMAAATAAPASPSPPDPPSPAEPFRFRASVARPGDTLLLCSPGLAEPLRAEPALAEELAGRWRGAGPPGLAEFLGDATLRVKGYSDDRTAVAVWDA